MISERSCDSDDLSNDVENSGINDILKYILTVILKGNNISQYYCVFDQFNAVLVSISN